VVLTLDKASDIERRIIQEEQEWKLKRQESTTNDLENINSSSNDKKSGNQPEPAIETAPIETQKEKTITASCNCGQLFSATTSKDKNSAQDDIIIKTYDASGSEGRTYTISGNESSKQDYAVKGSNNDDYARQ